MVEGPTLHEWCQLVAEFAGGSHAEVSAERRAHFENGADVRDVLADPGLCGEVARTGPGSHPSRALYGFYCDWVLRTSLSRLGPGVKLVRHRTRAMSIRPSPLRATVVELADGTSLPADSVALSPGWLPSELNRKDRELATLAGGLDVLWVPPESPIHQDLTGIRPGEDVIVRGLGMGFFDSVSMLTIGRGGRFEPSPAIGCATSRVGTSPSSTWGHAGACRSWPSPCTTGCLPHPHCVACGPPSARACRRR